MIFPSLHPNNEHPSSGIFRSPPPLESSVAHCGTIFSATETCKTHSAPPLPCPKIKDQVTARTTHGILLCLCLARQEENFSMLKLPSLTSKDKLFFICAGSCNGKGCTAPPRIGLQWNMAAQGNVPVTDGALTCNADVSWFQALE